MFANKKWHEVAFSLRRFIYQITGAHMTFEVSEHPNGDIVIKTNGNMRIRNVH
jgi:hypothetical protein